MKLKKIKFKNQVSAIVSNSFIYSKFPLSLEIVDDTLVVSYDIKDKSFSEKISFNINEKTFFISNKSNGIFISQENLDNNFILVNSEKLFLNDIKEEDFSFNVYNYKFELETIILEEQSTVHFLKNIFNTPLKVILYNQSELLFDELKNLEETKFYLNNQSKLHLRKCNLGKVYFELKNQSDVYTHNNSFSSVSKNCENLSKFIIK